MSHGIPITCRRCGYSAQVRAAWHIAAETLPCGLCDRPVGVQEPPGPRDAHGFLKAHRAVAIHAGGMISEYLWVGNWTDILPKAARDADTRSTDSALFVCIETRDASGALRERHALRSRPEDLELDMERRHPFLAPIGDVPRY